MRKSLIAAALFAGAIACGPLAGDAMAQKKVLNYGMASKDAGPLDPHRTATTPDKALLQMVFNGLVRFKPGIISLELMEPDLAEKWSTSADGKEWTFNLRQGVQCHHGYGELTSDDVVYSLKRAGDSKTSAFASDYKDFDKIEAVDKYTVKVTLKNPIAAMLGLVANYHGGNIVCKKAAEELGDNFKTKPIGTGPFMFEEYKPQQSVSLIANKQYFRGAPKLDRIIYRYLEADAARDLAFSSGELDIVYGRQDQTWVERTKNLKGAVIDVFEPAELSQLYLNVENEQLKDKRVRQALAYAIDRKGIVQFKGEAVSREAKSIVPIGYLGYTADVPLYPYDPEKAKALLKEAGYPNGITIKIIHTNLSGMLSFIQAVQAQLKKANINLEIDVVEHATFHANIRKDLSPIVHYAAGRFPVADVYLTQFFHSRSIVGTPTAVTNFTHCKDADAEIDAARVEPDVAKAKALWATAQKKLMENVCAIPVYEQLQVYAHTDSLVFGYDLKGILNLGPLVTEQTYFK